MLAVNVIGNCWTQKTGSITHCRSFVSGMEFLGKHMRSFSLLNAPPEWGFKEVLQWSTWLLESEGWSELLTWTPSYLDQGAS